MTITLNHTIVPAADNREAARFFASIMGLAELPPAGRNGHFAPVRVNETLTLDFMTVENPAGVHLAFDVDPATFDQILERLREAGVPYGSDPAHPDNGRIDHPLCPRGLFFVDAARNLYEVMSPA
ncbi:VOC family protein [Microbispora sp. GKU 823]|uniref:VOC family protein n=1 Tax=Microbispora sp. GKU 823 TaxID=1652100 RepID=UPI0009A44DD0|nr:VOC family protein [Microbispora sp. GKU 823]OPG14226.1 metallothiol transferase FosB [Microbispora sp. GKU 823]